MKKIILTMSATLLLIFSFTANAATFRFGEFLSVNSTNEGDHYLGHYGLLISVDQGVVGADIFVMPERFATRGISAHLNLGKFSIGLGKYRSRGEFTVTTRSGNATGDAQDTGNLVYIQYSINKHFFVRGTITDIDYHASGSLDCHNAPCSGIYGSRIVHANDKMLWLGYRF